MTRRVSLTFEGETMVDVYAAIELELARVRGNHAGATIPPVAPAPDPAIPRVPGASRSCSGGHGEMRLIPAGTAKSGPRIGQPYPAFWKCDTCGERQEAAA